VNLNEISGEKNLPCPVGLAIVMPPDKGQTKISSVRKGKSRQMQEAKKGQIKLLDGLWQSFYSRTYYQQVYKQWAGLGLRYLLFVSFVFGVLAASGFYLRAMAVIKAPDIDAIMHAMPTLKLKDGEISTSTNNVERINHPGSNSTVVMIVDPKDTIKDEAAAPVVLHSHEFTIQVPGRKPVVLPYKGMFRDGDITGDAILKQMNATANWLLLPIVAIVVVISFSFTFTKALVVAIILRAFKAKYSFADATRILFVASTPSIVLSGLGILANVHLGPMDTHLFNGIFVLYAIFAFRVCAQLDKNESTEDFSPGA